MANGSGVTVSEAKRGGYRVRWREAAAGGGWRQRERVVSTKAAATELAALVLRQIETRGYWTDPTAPEAPEVVSLDAIAAGYVQARAAAGAAPNTVRNSANNLARALRLVREVEKLPAGATVPASVLTRDLVIRVSAALAGGSADSAKHVIGALLAAWTWAADDLVTYPGVPVPPRSTVGLRPKPVPAAPAPAPTMAEVDAVIRALAASPSARRIALPAAVIMRYTGIRIEQALSLTPRDLNAASGTLLAPVDDNDDDDVSGTLAVRKGKSRAEKAGRIVPIHPDLVRYLLPLVAEAAREGRATIIRAQGAADAPTSPRRAVAAAWGRAEAAGLVRPEVWRGAHKRRPNHAFRAAYQHYLVEAGVRDEVIDRLVGHAAASTRDRHYVDASARAVAMKAAVDMLPPIDWTEPGEATNVIPLRA